MGNNISIQVENLSKAYQLGQIGTGTISRDLERFWTTKIRGKEDPFLKIGQTNDRTIKGDSDIVWSLKDINFEIEQGDAVGIIGRNGAGKSTLLKLLSRVTAPTTGNIKVKGRIASLLEVGTGFHPELTGRENIFLNGAILGMRKREIARKLDEIIDFSGVERYIDTPVKRYSSGMYVRLAFAVAAHLESEILIVDEVLAVGDAEFQKKCLGKMGEVSKGEGRTILFVSHNMASVKALCQSGILLENGLVKNLGTAESVVRNYLGGNSDNLNYRKINSINYGFELLDFRITNTGTGIDDPILRDEEIHFSFNYNNQNNEIGLYFNIKIKDEEGRYLITTVSEISESIIGPGRGSAQMVIPAGFFNEGQYFIDLMIIRKDETGYLTYFREPDVLSIQILPEKRDLGVWMGKEEGFIRHNFDWKI
jgi:lipopolysaccharide transport system ATP-binding protein